MQSCLSGLREPPWAGLYLYKGYNPLLPPLASESSDYSLRRVASGCCVGVHSAPAGN